MEKPRARKGDCQTGNDTLYCSSEGSGIVLFEVFLADDLQQESVNRLGEPGRGGFELTFMAVRADGVVER